MNKDELVEFLHTTEAGDRLDALIGELNSEIQYALSPRILDDTYHKEHISDWLYDKLRGLIDVADNILCRHKLANVWEALIWNPDDTKEQLVGYIKDAQDVLSALVGEKPGYFYERVHRGSVPSLVPGCPFMVRRADVGKDAAACRTCTNEDCEHYIPF